MTRSGHAPFQKGGIRDPDILWKLTVNEFGLSDRIRPHQPATISAAPK
jgi:hypothetical protein